MERRSEGAGEECPIGRSEQSGLCFDDMAVLKLDEE